MNYIVNYYNKYNEDGRLKRKNRLPEYLITMKYIEKYLKRIQKYLKSAQEQGDILLHLPTRDMTLQQLNLFRIT